MTDYRKKLLALCRGLEIENPAEAIEQMDARALEAIGKAISGQARKAKPQAVHNGKGDFDSLMSELKDARQHGGQA